MKFIDLARETATATGSNPLVLGGAAGAEFRVFAPVNGVGYAIGEMVPYRAVQGTQSEIGNGTKTANGIERTTVTASTNGGARVNFVAGPIDVHCNVSASSLGGLLDPDDTGFDIVLCAGQSNMEGNPASDPLIDVGDPRVYQWANASNVASYRSIIAGADPLHMPGGVRTDKTGPGTWFAKTYLATRPTNRLVLLVPVAVGSTGLVGSFWAPGNPGGSYYERAIADTNLAITAALQRFPNSRFVGTIWAQGEADGLNGTTQTQYATGLKGVIAGFRSRITGAANSWFVISGMTPEGIAFHTGEAPIHAAHQQVAIETDKCAFVPGVSGMAADVHYTAPGIRIMGTRMALAVRSALNYVGVVAAPTAPAQMAAPVVTAGVASASIAFTSPSNGGAAITGYTVTASTGQTATGSASPIVIALPANVAATFTITATNSVGTSAASPASNSVTPTAAATAPAQMAAPVATAGSGSVSVAYVAPSNGGSPITGYTATWSGGQSVSGTANPLVITGVTNGVAGTATITATNAVGISPASPASNSVTPQALTVPGAPTIGTATAGDGYIDVAFTAPASNGGSAILDYTATLSTGQTATGTVSPIRVTAPNGTAATATVKARNAQGLSAASAASNSVTPAAAGGGATYPTFSPADTAAGITLSNGNLTATGTAGFKSTRATASKTTGKWYFEYTIGAIPTIVGFGRAEAAITNFPGSNDKSWGYYNTGALYYTNAANGLSGSSYATYIAGDVIGIALDMDTKTARFYKNGVAQGSGSINLPDSSSDSTVKIAAGVAVYPMAGMNGGSVTVNFGATAFAYTPPTGFSAFTA